MASRLTLEAWERAFELQAALGCCGAVDNVISALKSSPADDDEQRDKLYAIAGCLQEMSRPGAIH